VECSVTKDHEEVFEKSQMYKLIDKHMNSIVLIINYPVVVETSVDKGDVCVYAPVYVSIICMCAE